MPELPEIHTITTDLKNNIIGHEIFDIHTIGTYKLDKDSISKVKNSKITNVYQIAKNILIELANKNTLVIHLAMTGKLLLTPNNSSDKYLRIVFCLKKNKTTRYLNFCDKRMFGKVQILTPPKLARFKDKYGLNPLDKNVTPKQYLDALHSKKTKLKLALMDQSIIAGIGNAYATEALWIAQMHPETLTKDLNINHAEKLLNATRTILKEGIKNRGISISDYVDIFGKPGKQQNYFRVYRKERCPKCNTKIQVKKLSGRNTYFCPSCQEKNTQKRLF